MSVVTNLILSTNSGLTDPADGDLVADYLFTKYGGVRMPDIYEEAEYENETKIVGGTKCLEADVRIAAYNCLDLDDLLRAMCEMPFGSPENVQLFVQEQDDFVFTERFQRAWKGSTNWKAVSKPGRAPRL